MYATPSSARRREHNHRAWLRPLTVALAGALVLSGCSTEPSDDAVDPPETEAAVPAETPASAVDPDAQPVEADEPASEEPVSEEPASEPATSQEESCGWDSPGLATSLPSIPSGQEGDLESVIIGAWQHTHFDSGSGYEALADEDIRYVFPSTDRMLYCQHIPGITEHAENAGDISWDGTDLVLPHGSVGYTATAWNSQVMVWHNHLDGSQYVLQRR